MPLTTSTAASAPRSVAAAKRPATTFSRQSSWRPTVTERGITLTFASGAFALKASRAQPVEPGTHPVLEATVQDLARRAQVPVPQLYLAERVAGV